VSRAVLPRRGARPSFTAAFLTVGVSLLAACAADPDDTRAPDVTFGTVAAADTTDPTDTGVTTTTADTGSSTVTDPSTSTTPPDTVAPSRDTVDLRLVADSLTAPVDLAVRRADPTLYVAQQGGQVVALRTDGTRSVILDVSGDISTGGERGLLGIAFTPSGDELVASMTDRDGNTLLIAVAVGDDGTADPDSRRVLYTARQPYPNHNGGDVAFGPDGMLYLGLGDGGAAGDPERHALDVSSPLGKMLRLDPTTTPASAPADNPFAGVAGALDEVWAVGLRNPWRFSFDPATGDLWIGDVGQDRLEEIDVARAVTGGGRGANFGWKAFEGSRVFDRSVTAPGAVAPYHEYPHGTGAGEGCSVTGGVVYRGSALAGLAGAYLFADYCVPGIRAVPAVGDGPPVEVRLTEGPTEVVAFGVDGSGEPLVVSLGGGLYRLDPVR